MIIKKTVGKPDSKKRREGKGQNGEEGKKKDLLIKTGGIEKNKRLKCSRRY